MKNVTVHRGFGTQTLELWDTENLLFHTLVQDARNGRAPLVIGYSMGGALAVMTASRVKR